MKKIATTIRSACTNRGLSQDALAQLAGLSVGTIARVMSPTAPRKPKPDSMRRISVALHQMAPLSNAEIGVFAGVMDVKTEALDAILMRSESAMRMSISNLPLGGESEAVAAVFARLASRFSPPRLLKLLEMIDDISQPDGLIDTGRATHGDTIVIDGMTYTSTPIRNDERPRAHQQRTEHSPAG